MHIKNQSYIARLGFADTDKSFREHDIACQYLAQPEKVIKLASLLNVENENIAFGLVDRERLNRAILEKFGRNDFYSVDLYAEVDSRSQVWKVMDIVPSYPLVLETSPTYRVIVGYYDLRIRFERRDLVREDLKLFAVVQRERIELDRELLDEEAVRKKFEREAAPRMSMAVEVKARPTSVTDIIQQMSTYREFDPYSQQILAACYQMSAGEKELLEKQGIKVIHLSRESLEEFARRKIDSNLDAF